MAKGPRGPGRILREIIAVGVALSSERDLEKRLDRVLFHARRLTAAEAGTLFLPEGEVLRFAVVQNDALKAQFGVEEMAHRLRAEPLPMNHASIAGHAALTGETVNVQDVERLEDDVPFRFASSVDRRTGYQTHSVLAVPLNAPTGELLGVLELINARDERGRVVPFAKGDEMLVRTLAPYAGVMLRNAQLNQHAESRAAKLATLTQLTHLMLAARDPEAVFREIARAATVLLGAKAARLWIDDPHAKTLRMRSGFGRDPGLEQLFIDYPTLPYRAGAVGRVFASRTPIYIEEVLDDPRWVNRRLATEGDLHGFAGVPLVNAKRTLGVLAVFFGERRRLTEEEQELLGLLTDHAALVVEMAQLHEAEARRTRRLATLTRLNQLISSSLSTVEVLRALTRAAAELMEASYVAIWVADAARATLERAATPNEPVTDGFPATRRRFGEGVVGSAAEQRELLVIPDIAKDTRVLERAWFEAHGVQSILALPIAVGDDCLGVLTLGGPESLGEDSDRRHLLDSLAAQAAIALRNARVYEDLRLAHEQLEQSQTQLLHSEKLAALGQFVAGIAHELNNPLAAVLGYAYLADGTTDAARLKDHIGKIEASAERAARIVRNLLQFARKSAPGDEPVDLNVLVDHALTGSPAAPEGIAVVRDVAPSLPVTAGNPDELQQVILNLVTNAYQAMAERGGVLTVRTRAVGGTIRVDVTDTGPGIPPPMRLRIFDPFFTTKPVGAGTGLGLSVARGIVEAHGGRLWLDESRRVGARFVVELPVRPPAAARPPSPEPQVPTGRRVLVVDDEPEVAEVLAGLLRELGCDVAVTHSAQQARGILAREAFDLITLDLLMPQESGAELWRALQSTQPEFAAKVVFVSGAAQAALLRFIESTGRPALAKPFTLQQLRALLAGQLPSPGS